MCLNQSIRMHWSMHIYNGSYVVQRGAIILAAPTATRRDRWTSVVMTTKASVTGWKRIRNKRPRSPAKTASAQQYYFLLILLYMLCNWRFVPCQFSSFFAIWIRHQTFSDVFAANSSCLALTTPCERRTSAGLRVYYCLWWLECHQQDSRRTEAQLWYSKWSNQTHTIYTHV